MAKGAIKGAKFTWKHPVATFGVLTFAALLPTIAVFAAMALLMGIIGFVAVMPGTLNVVPSKAAIQQVPREYLADLRGRCQSGRGTLDGSRRAWRSADKTGNNQPVRFYCQDSS